MRWKMIKDLFHFEKGSLQSSKCTPGEYTFVTAASEWKTHNEYSHDCEALIFAAAASGSLGRTHYINGKFISSDLCFIITPRDPEKFPVDLKFYHLIFQVFKDEIVRNTKAGTSKEAIGLSVFGKYELPYFDIKKQLEVKEQFIALQESAIDLSSECTHQLSLVKQLRQAFLREAMQGKLVAQDPQDVPAAQLLAKIKAEKERLIGEKRLKRGNETSQSKSDIETWQFPNTWVSTKVDDLFFVTKLAGFEYTNHFSLKEKGDVPVIRAQNVRPLEIDKSNLLFIDRETSFLLERCALTKEALLVTFIGAGIGDVARFHEVGRWHLAPNVAKLEPFEGCEAYYNLKFTNYFFLSSYGRAEIFKHVKATAQPSLSMGTIRDIDVLMPPLAEQHRIVAKLDELMRYCDALEASIQASREQNEGLLQQVLREALEPGNGE